VIKISYILEPIRHRGKVDTDLDDGSVSADELSKLFKDEKSSQELGQPPIRERYVQTFCVSVKVAQYVYMYRYYIHNSVYTFEDKYTGVGYSDLTRFLSL
jgi:hypothetical protein